MTDDAPTSALIVATPTAGQASLADIEDPHITTLWFGDAAALQAEADVLTGVQQALAEVTGRYTGFEAKVSGVAMLGPDKASVLLIESAELVEIRAELCSYPAVEAAWLMADHQFPWWVCHLTVGYSGKIPENPPETIRFDSLALWMAEEKTPYPLLSLGGPAMAAALIPPVECPEDLPICLQYADTHPDARWYAAKRASAFGMSDRVPVTWMADA